MHFDFLRSPLSVRRTITFVAACTAAMVTIGVPLLYGVTSYSAQTEKLSWQANTSASRIARYIYQYGTVWPYHRVRLAELIELPESEKGANKQRIFTAQNKLVLAEEAEPSAPTIVRSHPIIVSGKVVGRLSIEATARSLAIKTVLVLLCSLLLGLAVYFSVRLLPLRALDKTLAELEKNNRRLIKTEVEKEQEQLRLQMEMEAARRKELDKLADILDDNISKAANAVATTTYETDLAARTVASSVEAANDQTRKVAESSQEIASSMQMVSASTEELAAAIGEVARTISSVSAVARKAKDVSQNTHVTIASLSGSAQKVGEIVKLIGSIADQTNLLALNATIEAARAGDFGRGFAVVAQEVKMLANEAAKATDIISKQIAEMQAATNRSVSEIAEIGKIIDNINIMAGGMTEAADQQLLATNSIASSVEIAARGAYDVSVKIADVDQVVLKTSSAIGLTIGATNTLKSNTEQLLCSIKEFVEKVRAA